MKTIMFENIRTFEKWSCNNVHDIQIIDNVEYLKVYKDNKNRTCLIRKDVLKKVQSLRP